MRCYSRIRPGADLEILGGFPYHSHWSSNSTAISAKNTIGDRKTSVVYWIYGITCFRTDSETVLIAAQISVGRIKYDKRH